MDEKIRINDGESAYKKMETKWKSQWEKISEFNWLFFSCFMWKKRDWFDLSWVEFM